MTAQRLHLTQYHMLRAIIQIISSMLRIVQTLFHSALMPVVCRCILLSHLGVLLLLRAVAQADVMMNGSIIIRRTIITNLGLFV